MKNRIISLLLAIMMVAGMLPTVAFAAEDTAPSEITGVAITVDGVTYTEGDVTIKPDSTITVTFLGTNLEQQNPACIIDTPHIYIPLTQTTVYEDGTVSSAAYPHFFEGADRYPIIYTNDNWATTHESGIFVTFDDTIAGAPTEITGLTITVDGVTYTEGNVIIKPDSTLSITVLGSNLQVGSSTSVIDTPLAYLPLHALPLNENGEYIYETYASAFVGGVNYPITYTNDGWATRHDSGIFVTYDDGTVTPEPDQPDDTTAQITGVTVTVDGVSYAQGDVVITPDTQFLVFTAYGTDFMNLSESNILSYTPYDTEPLTYFVIDTEVNTATLNRSANVPWFVDCDHFQVQYSNDGGATMIDTGIYLTYDDGTATEPEDTTPAEITGVSVTVDGVTYTQGDVIITPESTVSFTVSGTNFGNLHAERNILVYLYSTSVSEAYGWTVDPVNHTATRDFTDRISDFVFCDGSEVMYTNDGRSTWHDTGIYLTYRDASCAHSYSRDCDTHCALCGALTRPEATHQSSANFPCQDGICLYGCDATVPATAQHEYQRTEAREPTCSNDGHYVYECRCGSFYEEYPSATGQHTYLYDCSIACAVCTQPTRPEAQHQSDATAPCQYGTCIFGCGSTVSATESHSYLFQCDTHCNTCGELTRPEATHLSTEPYACMDGKCRYGCGLAIPAEDHTYTLNADVPPSCDTGGYKRYSCQCGDFYEEYPSATGEHTYRYDCSITCADCTQITRPEAEHKYSSTNTCQQRECIYGCGYIQVSTQAHSYNYNCDTHCTQCGELTRPEATHQSNQFPCRDGICNAGCGLAMPATAEHSYDSDSDPSCNVCGDVREVADEPGRITGVSITVDGVTYTEGNLTITPDTQSVIYTVTGTNFANLSGNNFLWYTGDGIAPLLDAYFVIDTVENTATLDITSDLFSQIESCNNFEVQYSNDNLATLIGSGIYLTYEKPVPDSTGKIVIDIADAYSDGWNGAAIEVYKNGTLETTATNEIGKFATVELVYDSTASYEFKWVTGIADEECAFVIYADGESVMACEIDEAHFENGETILTLAAKDAPEIPALRITRQPTNAEVKMGERFCVEVLAQGEGLTYRWYFKNANAIRFSKSSVTDNTYDDVMTLRRMDRQIYCVITDAYGNSVTTDTVTLIAVPGEELAITAQPSDAGAKLGEEFCVTVEAQGDDLQYQWYFRKAGTENWKRSSVRDNTYNDVMTAARHNREVYCVITDAWGNSVTTEIATIRGIANEELAIVTQPFDEEVPLGEMFNVFFEAKGDGLKYQWYFRKAGTEKWKTSAQRDNSYDDVMTVARHNRELYCVVTDAWGNTVSTDPIVVIMAQPVHPLAITAQPADASAKLGEEFCVTVEAQGDGLTYHWYYRKVGTEAWKTSGVRDNTYDDVMTAARHNREVYCVITDMWGNSVTTEIATIRGIPTAELAIVQQPANGEAKMGEMFYVEVLVQGDGLKYQWYFRNEGAARWNKSGVTDNTYDDVMTQRRAGREIYCVITDAWGNTVTTETVTLIATN